MPVTAADPSSAPLSPSFEIKSAQLEGMVLLPKTAAPEALTQALLQQYGPHSESPGFFENDPVVIDCAALSPDSAAEDLPALLLAVRACGLLPVALRGAPPAWAQAGHGLALLAPAVVSKTKARAASVATAQEAQEVEREVVREAPPVSTLVVDKPLRSGQKIYARGGDLVVLAMVNQGAEIAADGNIHVYAPLRGRAMAGARGNTQARIFSTCMEPELLSIAGIYRTSETALPAAVQGKPAQVRLSSDGLEKLIIESLKT